LLPIIVNQVFTSRCRSGLAVEHRAISCWTTGSGTRTGRSCAYLIFFRLLARAGATNVGLVTFLIPVSAILLGVLILGEALAARHFAGMALIGLGLILIDGRAVSAVTARFSGKRLAPRGNG